MRMVLQKTAAFLAVLLLSAASVWAGSDADAAFTQGEKLLASGDLRAALKQYGAAVKLDSSNQQYLQQYLMVRQVLKLQDALAKESDPPQWERTAIALRSFFSAQGLSAEALTLDRAIWERSQTSDNAIQLADTLLALDKNGEAAELLANLDSRLAGDASRALLAVALARQGKLPEAQKIAGGMGDAGKSDPGALYLVARMHAAVGNDDQALAALGQCFAAVPPSRLDPLKTLTRECRDFSRLASLAAFAAVLQTTSKVPESKCSGGSSCSTCPMRGNCAHGEASK
jgi:tetratricopeptide (TPR) repeat protein